MEVAWPRSRNPRPLRLGGFMYGCNGTDATEDMTRMAMVEEIKSLVERGEYSVAPEDVADAIIRMALITCNTPRN